MNSCSLFNVFGVKRIGENRDEKCKFQKTNHEFDCEFISMPVEILDS